MIRYDYITDAKNSEFMALFKEYFKEIGIKLKDKTDVFDQINNDIKTHDIKILVAFDETNMVAFSMWQENHLADNWFFRLNTGFIREYFVQQNYRKKGIAKAMLQEIESFFLKRDIHTLILTCDEALAFWQHEGFLINECFEALNELKVLTKRI